MVHNSPVDLTQFPKPKPSDALSPFRYPGGKAVLAGYIASRIASVGTCNKYAEPFCGGAGSALYLLKNRNVDEIYLNDLDLHIYSAWRAMLSENDRFIDRLQTVEVNINTWEAAQETLRLAKAGEYSFDLGFATLFLNRTSRSGIISGSGPIGGYDQNGAWKIDARFYRETLIKRVKWLGENRDKINLTNMDAVEFINDILLRDKGQRTFFFIDPPYVKAGARLYLNAMNEGCHLSLSRLLQSGKFQNWMLTYDKHPFILMAYEASVISDLEIGYSLQKKRKATEVLIEPRTPQILEATIVA